MIFIVMQNLFGTSSVVPKIC